jgi:hypothetical protein
MKTAGLLALLMFPTAFCALVLCIVALVALAKRPAGALWLWLGSAAAALAGLAAGLGALAGGQALGQMRAALGAPGLAVIDLEQLCAAGYRDARFISVVALVVAALPLLGAGAVLALAFGKARSSGSVEPRHRGLVATLGLVVAVVGVAAAASGLRYTAAASRAYLATRASTYVVAAMARTDCDPCPALELALFPHTPEALEQAVPGSRARAKKCVGDRLQAIEAAEPGKLLPACNDPSDDAPPRPSLVRPESEGAGVPAPGSALEQRIWELERLGGSRLVFDADDRAQIEALKKRHTEELAAASAPPAAPPSDSAGSGLPGTATVASAGVSGGAIDNASTVVARMRARFRYCYNRGLKTNPQMSGSVTLVARVGANGEVTNVGGSAPASLKPIEGCLKAVVQGSMFEPPKGGDALVTIPISFVQQQP